MKIFMPGSTSAWAAEASMARLFREKGAEVRIVENKPAWPSLGRPDWWKMSRPERMIHDAFVSQSIYRECKAWKPDVLFLPKAENIHSYAIRRILEETKARLVTWYPDNPFKADQTSINILRNLRRYDLFYIWGKFLIDALVSAGCRRTEYLPFGFDPVVHPEDIEITEEDRKRYSCDVMFIGTWDAERQQALEPLSRFDLAVWGPGWKENVPQSNRLARCIRGGGVYLGEMAKAFRCAKLCFNHLRIHNGSAHNVRTMEITGIGGGVQLVRRTPEQAQELFTEGKHLLCFDSVQELTDKAESLLADPDAGKSISIAARNHVWQNHLLSARIEQILDDIRKL